MMRTLISDPVLCGWSSMTEKMIHCKEDVIENYKSFSAAGFNMTGLRPFENQEKFAWVLEAFEKYRIMYVFESPRRGIPDDESVIEADVRVYCLHSHCAGVFILDEPSATDFPLVLQLKALYEKYLPEGKLVISNLYPNYANTTQLGSTQINTPSDKKWVPIPSENVKFLIDEYDEYVESYMTIVKPPALCYDHYMISKAFRSSTEQRKALIFRFMMNLSVIAKAGKKHRTPYWNIIQALSFCKQMITPDVTEYRWMANMSYVLGVSLLVTFIYRNYYDEKGGPEEWYDAPVTFSGDKTFAYDVVKNTNTQLRNYLKALSGMNHQGVYGRGLPDYISSPLKGLLLEKYPDWVHDITGDCEVIIGYLKDETSDGLLMMNSSFEKTGSIEVKVREPGSYEIWNQAGRCGEAAACSVMELEPGECVLLLKM